MEWNGEERERERERESSLLESCPTIQGLSNEIAADYRMRSSGETRRANSAESLCWENIWGCFLIKSFETSRVSPAKYLRRRRSNNFRLITRSIFQTSESRTFRRSLKIFVASLFRFIIRIRMKWNSNWIELNEVDVIWNVGHECVKRYFLIFLYTYLRRHCMSRGTIHRNYWYSTFSNGTRRIILLLLIQKWMKFWLDKVNFMISLCE